MSSMERLEINGEMREYRESEMPGTVAELVLALALNPDMVVAEVNGRIVKRVDFAARGLSDGDRVELVRFVGGG